MTKETQNTNAVQEKEDKRPDYIAKQYRQVRVEDGFRTRRETIGALWKNPNGSLMFRPTGVQIIESDIYFFPTESKEAQ